MFKEVMTHMNLGDLSTAGMILFFLVFLGVTFYAMTRPPSQAEQWARIPLAGEDGASNQPPENPRP
jgi:cbb3-type cytochrome oxidase subunit 3